MPSRLRIICRSVYAAGIQVTQLVVVMSVAMKKILLCDGQVRGGLLLGYKGQTNDSSHR